MSGRPSRWTTPGPRSGSNATLGTLRGFSGASGSMSPRPDWSERSWEDEMLYARISTERIGVLIGPEGATKDRVAQIRARLIGTRGKTRRLIEELTGVEVSVWGHTVALIGGTFEMAIAREAVFMLLRGSEHKTVYRFLERKRADLKVYQMGF